MRAAQFICIFIENCIYNESLTKALDVYESFRVLEALPTRWSPVHSSATAAPVSRMPHVLMC